MEEEPKLLAACRDKDIVGAALVENFVDLGDDAQGSGLASRSRAEHNCESASKWDPAIGLG